MRNRLLLIAVTLSTLAGCANRIPHVEADSVLLDTDAQLLCLNNGASCRAMSLIGANANRDKILRHWDVDPFDWSQLRTPSDLASLLLTPPNGSYSVTKLSETRYRLSISPATLDAWSVLDAENHNRYLEEDR